MTNLRQFALAGALALAIGSAFSGMASAQSAGGGGGGGDGGAGAGGFIETPSQIPQINLPPGRARYDRQGREATFELCRYELIRGRFCEAIPYAR